MNSLPPHDLSAHIAAECYAGCLLPVSCGTRVLNVSYMLSLCCYLMPNTHDCMKSVCSLNSADICCECACMLQSLFISLCLYLVFAGCLCDVLMCEAPHLITLLHGRGLLSDAPIRAFVHPLAFLWHVSISCSY